MANRWFSSTFQRMFQREQTPAKSSSPDTSRTQEPTKSDNAEVAAAGSGEDSVLQSPSPVGTPIPYPDTAQTDPDKGPVSSVGETAEGAADLPAPDGQSGTSSFDEADAVFGRPTEVGEAKEAENVAETEEVREVDDAREVAEAQGVDDPKVADGTKTDTATDTEEKPSGTDWLGESQDDFQQDDFGAGSTNADEGDGLLTADPSNDEFGDSFGAPDDETGSQLYDPLEDQDPVVLQASEPEAGQEAPVVDDDTEEVDDLGVD